MYGAGDVYSDPKSSLVLLREFLTSMSTDVVDEVMLAIFAYRRDL